MSGGCALGSARRGRRHGSEDSDPRLASEGPAACGGVGPRRRCRGLALCASRYGARPRRGEPHERQRQGLWIPVPAGDLRLLFEGEALRVESPKALVGAVTCSSRAALMTGEGPAAFDGVGRRTWRPTWGSRIRPADGRRSRAAGAQAPWRSQGVRACGPKRISTAMRSGTVDVTGTGNGVLLCDGRSDSPRFRADATGSVEAALPEPTRTEAHQRPGRSCSARARVAIRECSGDHRVRERPDRRPASRPASITAQVRDGRLRIAVPESTRSKRPRPGDRCRERRGAHSGLTLAGEGTSVSISGKLALQPGRKRSHHHGTYGPSRFRGSRGVAAARCGHLRSQITGTRNAVRLSGGLDVEDGAVRVRAFPGPRRPQRKIVFSETPGQGGGPRGRFGGGRVSVSARWVLAAFRVVRFLSQRRFARSAVPGRPAFHVPAPR